MKHNFFIKRNGYNVKRGPLKKHKIIPLNLILKVEKQYLKAFPSSKKLSILEMCLPVCWAGEFWMKMRKKETSWSTIIQGDKDKKVKLLPQIKRFEKNVLISLPSDNTISAKPSCQHPRNIFPTNPRNTHANIWVTSMMQSTAQEFTHLILTLTSWGYYNHEPSFPDEESVAHTANK